jgi:hypothetical protein
MLIRIIIVYVQVCKRAIYLAKLLLYALCNMEVNRFADEQLNLLGTMCENKFAILVHMIIYHISSRSAPADRLHPKQNIESELKRQTCYIFCIKMHQNVIA